MTTKTVKKGFYKHYKGGQYEVLGEAVNLINKEELVIYQEFNRKKNEVVKAWARPKLMFLEEVEIEGVKKPRFEYIGDQELTADNQSFEQKYLRALADYQNLLKRTAQDRIDFVKYANHNLIEEMLPVFDHLKLSLIGLSETEEKSPWAIGVSHVLNQFREILKNNGLEEIKTLGENFNHETMEAVEGEGEIVVKEIIPGYKLNGKVIRPAKVITTKE